MIQIYYKIIDNNLSVRKSEQVIKKFQGVLRDIHPTISDKKEIDNLAQTLNPYLKTRINTTLKKKEGGVLNIHFTSLEELIRIIKLIKNE